MVSGPWDEPGRGLFSISVAAELTGLHPRTLRSWEQEGLVLPARSAGGTRRYSAEDLSRLDQIMTLTSEGVNLAGVRRILELQEQKRLLQAEIEQLTAAASNQPSGPGSAPGASPPQSGESFRLKQKGNQRHAGPHP